MTTRPTLFLTVGLPGTGKTTEARRIEIEKKALRLTKDEWVKALYGLANPASASDVIEGRLIEIGLRAPELGINVVLDFGFWGGDERSALRVAAEHPRTRGVLRSVRASLDPPETLQQWRNFQAANLTMEGRRTLEAKGEQYIATPLLLLAGIERYRQQHRMKGGVADYVILGESTGAFTPTRSRRRAGTRPRATASSLGPLSVVEVKVRVKEPVTGNWAASPDLAQVMRYSQALGDVPAMLLDSHRILLIEAGKKKHRIVFDRSAATNDDIDRVTASSASPTDLAEQGDRRSDP